MFPRILAAPLIKNDILTMEILDRSIAPRGARTHTYTCRWRSHRREIKVTRYTCRFRRVSRDEGLVEGRSGVAFCSPLVMSDARHSRGMKPDQRVEMDRSDASGGWEPVLLPQRGRKTSGRLFFRKLPLPFSVMLCNERPMKL